MIPAHSQQTIDKLNANQLKLPKESTSKALLLDSSGQVKSSSNISDTELDYLDGLSDTLVNLLSGKEATITPGTTSDYFRGDKTFQTLDKAAVGLSNVDNTSDATKNSAIATLTNKTLTSPVINSPTGLVKADVGLSNVDNTSDSNKPISTATQTALNLKADDSSVVHNTGNESISGTKTFTGKLVASSTSNGSTPCPAMTGAQISALTGMGDGDCVYNTTTKALNYYNGTTSAWTAIGSGGGGGTRLELMSDGSFESGVADGSCSGCTASQESTIVMTTPNNTKALKMLFSASTGSYTIDKSTSVYFTNADGTVGAWIRTDQSGCYFKSRQNGADTGDQKTILNDSTYHYYQLNFNATATSIGYKVDCTSSITGSVYVDESTVKVDPRLSAIAYVANDSDWTDYTVTAGGFGTLVSQKFKWRREGAEIVVMGSLEAGTTTATPASFSLPVFNGTQLSIDSSKLTNFGSLTILDGEVHVSGSTSVGNYVVDSGCNPHADSSDYTKVFVSCRNSLTAATTVVTPQYAANNLVVTNGQLQVYFRAPILGWQAVNPNYLTAPETFSTDYNTLTFKTSAVTSSDAVGTYSTYSYTINSNTKTVCATAPTTAPNSSDGILIFTRAYNAASTCASPVRYEIQIGKNLKGVTRNLYKSTGKSIGGSLGYYHYSAGAGQYGLEFQDYNEATGILTLDAGYNFISSITAASFLFNDLTSGTSGYLTITASKNPALTGLNIPKSEVWVYGGNGNGSSSTKIRRFVTVGANFGSDITDSGDSATLGRTFTINTVGVYAMTYCDAGTTLNSYFGISKNSTQLTTTPTSINAADLLAMTATLSNNTSAAACVTTTSNLSVGDVIRAHTEGLNNSTSSFGVSFRITKVSF
jgi:hypothetical protein